MLCLTSFPSGLFLCQNDKLFKFLRCIKQRGNMLTYHHRHQKYARMHRTERQRVPPCDSISSISVGLSLIVEAVSGDSPSPWGVKPPSSVAAARPGSQSRGQAWRSCALPARVGGGPAPSFPGVEARVPVFSIPDTREPQEGRQPPEAAPSVSGSRGGCLRLAGPGGLGDASVLLPSAATARESSLISGLTRLH